jgi:hypothetical protein
VSWHALEQADAELAREGAERFGMGVAYLATIRKDGSPRVHPVTPIVGRGRLFLFMEPSSPKGYDLRRDGRYAMHSAVGGPEGEGGEFLISGHAYLAEDSASRELAAKLASYRPADHYVLFELGVDSALSTTYGEDDPPVRRRWERVSTRTNFPEA